MDFLRHELEQFALLKLRVKVRAFQELGHILEGHTIFNEIFIQITEDFTTAIVHEFVPVQSIENIFIILFRYSFTFI